MKEEIKQLFYKNIYEWVKQNFGESEAEDPSWNIEALAQDLADSSLAFDIYKTIEREYLRDDCNKVAKGMGVELSDKEREVVVDEFMDSEAYVDAHAEDWQWFIKQELKHREENK